MVLVSEDPFVTLLAQAGRQTKIEHPTRRAFAVEQTDGKRHVVARGDLNLSRFEDDPSARIREEEIPRLVIGIEASDLVGKVEHHEIGLMMREDCLAAARADCARPGLNERADFVFVRHASFSCDHDTGSFRTSLPRSMRHGYGHLAARPPSRWRPQPRGT